MPFAYAIQTISGQIALFVFIPRYKWSTIECLSLSLRREEIYPIVWDVFEAPCRWIGINFERCG